MESLRRFASVVRAPLRRFSFRRSALLRQLRARTRRTLDQASCASYIASACGGEHLRDIGVRQNGVRVALKRKVITPLETHT